LVSGTKGPGFDPRVALHQVPKIIRIVIVKNRIPTVSKAPFEGPFLFGTYTTPEPAVELHACPFFDRYSDGVTFPSSRDIQRPLDMLLIPLILAKFTSWQEI
jgi:hypothetical protein